MKSTLELEWEKKRILERIPSSVYGLATLFHVDQSKFNANALSLKQILSGILRRNQEQIVQNPSQDIIQCLSEQKMMITLVINSFDQKFDSDLSVERLTTAKNLCDLIIKYASQPSAVKKEKIRRAA